MGCSWPVTIPLGYIRDNMKSRLGQHKTRHKSYLKRVLPSFIHKKKETLMWVVLWDAEDEEIATIDVPDVDDEFGLPYIIIFGGRYFVRDTSKPYLLPTFTECSHFIAESQ